MAVFNSDQGQVKRHTNPEGDGVSRGAGGALEAASPPPNYDVSVKRGSTSAGDVQTTHVGPNAGTGGGVGGHTTTQGFVSSTGNKVLINNTPGADTIELTHHTGSQILIDPDGSIHVYGVGRKGANLIAPGGDATVFASQHLILKGDGGITVETEGDLELNVGKNFYLSVGGDFITVVEGSHEFSVDGTSTEEVVKDVTKRFAGNHRTEVAGDKREQVTGRNEFDTGKDFLVKTDNYVDINAVKEVLIKGKENVLVDSSAGDVRVVAQNDVRLSAKGDMLTTTDGTVAFESTDSAFIRSKKHVVLSAQKKFFMDATQTAELRSGGAFSVDTKDAFAIKSTLASTVDAGTTLNMKGSSAAYLQATSVYLNSTQLKLSGTTDIQSSTPLWRTLPGQTSVANAPSADSATAPTAPGDPTPADIRATLSLTAPTTPVYQDANTIIDSLTSERESPEFPVNTRRSSNESMTTMENEGSEAPSPARRRAIGNKGAGVAINPGSGGGTIPPNVSSDHNRGSGKGSNATSKKSPFEPPTSTLNSTQKISKHITVGMLPRFNEIPPGEAKSIIDNLAHVCYNILDPLWDQFPGQVRITSAYRSWGPGSAHRTGKAIDICAVNKHDWNKTAEIAAYIRDNLPYDRLFLEKNDSPGIHVHVEAAPSGTNGRGVVWTCADPKCNSRTDGLQLQYAVAALKRHGIA